MGGFRSCMMRKSIRNRKELESEEESEMLFVFEFRFRCPFDSYSIACEAFSEKLFLLLNSTSSSSNPIKLL
ncbi:hypothetical protein Peur_040734 [Populus x canadensis]